MEEWGFAFFQSSGVRVESVVEPETIALDARTNFVLSRLIQEAMATIQNHAHATKAEICILEQEDHLFVSIRDNGKSPEMAQYYETIGRNGERINTLKGGWSVESNAGKGTELMITLPQTKH